MSASILSDLAGLFAQASQVQGVCRQVFGIPDYQRYLAHASVTHAGQPVMSESEFFARAIDRRYGGLGPRCC